MKSIVFSQPGMKEGGSLYGSQGDQVGSRTFIGIIRHIAECGTEKNGIHCQVAVIRKVIEMLNQYCGVEHLGVMSLMEMFRFRFLETSTGRLLEKDKMPSLKTSLSNSVRMVPLYAPFRDNCLSWKSGDEIIGRYLFIDTNGKVVHVDYRQRLSGNILESPYVVSVFYAENGVLAECLNYHYLVFDHCLRNLIELAQGAATRAAARAEAARKSIDALTIVAEEMRAGDLMIAILLSEEEPRGMEGSEINRDIFRRLVEKAGNTADARRTAFGVQMELLGRKSLAQISHLSVAETDEIISTWKIG